MEIILDQSYGTIPEGVMREISDFEQGLKTSPMYQKPAEEPHESVIKSEGKYDPNKGTYNFRDLCNAGVIVMNPYSVRSSKTTIRTGNVWIPIPDPHQFGRDGYDPETGAWGIRRVYMTYWYQRIWLPNHIPSFDEIIKTQVDTDGLVLRAFADANSATVDLLTELAELNGTLATPKAIIDAAKGIIRYKKQYEMIVRRIARGERANTASIKKFQKHVKAFGKAANPFEKGSLASQVTDAWMLYRFGILPVIGTFEDVRDALQQKERLFYSVAAKQPINVSETKEYWDSVHTYTITGEARVTVRSRIDKPMKANAEFLGVNPALTAWELVPQSWLVDRFISIGDWISAHSKPRSVVERAASLSFKYKIVAEASVKSSQPVAYEYQVWPVGSISATVVKIEPPKVSSQLLNWSHLEQVYSRTLVGGPPLLPTTTLSVNDWSLAMFADAFALATQKLRR